MKILEILEERRTIIEPPAEELATGEALVETITVESVTPLEIALEDVIGSKVTTHVASTIEVSSAGIAALEDIFLEVITLRLPKL